MKKEKKDPQKLKKIKPFINKHNWQGINYSSEKDDWKKIKKNNLTIALNVLYAKKEKIHPVHVLKQTSNSEKQVLLWMIPNWKGWHNIA